MQEIPLEKPNKLNESENKNILFPLIINYIFESQKY